MSIMGFESDRSHPADQSRRVTVSILTNPEGQKVKKIVQTINVVILYSRIYSLHKEM